MVCSDAHDHIAAFAVGSLDDGSLRVLRRHLDDCAPCRDVAAAYVRTARQLPMALEPQEPSPGLKTRLMAAVYADAAGSAGAGSRPAPWFRRLWHGVPAARGWTLAGGLATAAAVVAMAWLGNANRHTTPGASAIPLSGTTARPLAHGALTYDTSRHSAVLTVDGLGPQPTPIAGVPPRYEVWLINTGGAAEPAAYLAPEPRGPTWTGAFEGDMSRYKAIAVTLEPSEGGLSPSGPEVLRADLKIAP
ncbi:MAG: anti-sigma factor domain-containing protein [Candidatus Dormibacteria bacterium]